MQLRDAVGNIIQLETPPRRIVSLFPSQTHLLWKLGLDKEVVGLTRFCKYPPQWKKEKRVVGGTKDVKPERVAELRPDLILANKEENTKEIVEKLKDIAPVYVSEVETWQDNLDFVKNIGMLTGTSDKARLLVDEMEEKRRHYEKQRPSRPMDALYFIWRNPWMTAGKHTFINTMLELAGFKNLTPEEKGRYPAWETGELRALHPEAVLLCDEPFPFKPGKHYDEVKNLFPSARILFVRGEPFTWFGAYPVNAFDYFSTLQKQLHHAQ